MRKSVLAAFGFVLLSLAAPAWAIDFQVGQGWSYDARPGEEASQIYIARIDRGLGTRTIYHIYVDGLQLKNPLIEGGLQNNLSHIPLTKEALEASVIGEPRQLTAVPDISEGYVIWREAFLKGQAGVFTLPLKQIVQHIEDAFNKPKE
ncbi:MAG: hypothetical protein RH942_13825 [Kiloniellaceae bacterium]